MVAERALAARTIRRYEGTARRLLAPQPGRDPVAVAQSLTAASVTAFLLAESGRGLCPGSLQGRVAELRSLLRFLFVAGFTATPLAAAVPPVPGWRATSVPSGMAAADVRVLLASCDRNSATGTRDFAMLLLLARLGLRAAEVAGLGLDDLDWRAGVVVVGGKSRRRDPMPMATDVGRALAAYLTNVRTRADSRAVFLTVVAPARPMGPTSVSEMVRRRCRDAGLPPARAHRLRYALATDLLGQGATLPEIAQVLRQRDLATTAVYAKVDHARLRELALPWAVTQ